MPDTIGNQLQEIDQHLVRLVEDGTDYAPMVKVFAIPLIITTLTLMIPFIFSIISRIDDKYEADKFSKLFTSHWSFFLFCATEIFALLLIGAYALFRKVADDSVWSVVFFITSISVVVFATSLLWHALHLNNPRNVVDDMFSEYDNGFCSPTKAQEFYSLCLRIVHYGIVSENAILRIFVEKLIDLHIKKSNDYTEDLYNFLCDIAADYKVGNDNLDVNYALAFLFSSLIDDSPNGNTKQETYNCLLSVMYFCVQNGHHSIINTFQSNMRHAYYIIEDNQGNTINDSQERASRLLLFAITMNALLYGKACYECVDDALKKNLDAAFLSSAIIIPSSSNECLDIYLWAYAILSNEPEFKYFVWVCSDMTNYSNATQLYRYLSSYFAYLIKVQHQKQLDPDEIRNSAYLRDDIINRGFEYLISNSPDEETKTYIANLRNEFGECQRTIFTTEHIDKAYCEAVMAQDISHKRLATTLHDLATFDSTYMQGADMLLNLTFHKIIERKYILSKNIGNVSGLISNMDFGSRVIESINDSLADIYNSFERDIETINSGKLLKQRIRQFVTKYDYVFLTTYGIRINDITRSTYFAWGRFSQYFPAQSVIVIAKPDLPYIEWKDSNVTITSLDEVKTTSLMPEVDVNVDLHMSIHYKSTTKIHVLEVV